MLRLSFVILIGTADLLGLSVPDPVSAQASAEEALLKEAEDILQVYKNERAKPESQQSLKTYGDLKRRILKASLSPQAQPSRGSATSHSTARANLRNFRCPGFLGGAVRDSHAPLRNGCLVGRGHHGLPAAAQGSVELNNS